MSKETIKTRLGSLECQLRILHDQVTNYEKSGLDNKAILRSLEHMCELLGFDVNEKEEELDILDISEGD